MEVMRQPEYHLHFKVFNFILFFMARPYYFGVVENNKDYVKICASSCNSVYFNWDDLFYSILKLDFAIWL